jgi:hypothetical protein
MKHKKDQRNPPDKSRIDEYPGKYFQGYMHASSKESRQALKKTDIKSGSMFKKIMTWFEWN